MRRLLLLIAILCMGAFAYAQDIEPVTPPTGTEPIAITFPVAVYSLSGEVTVAGSANAQGMSNYFIEFRPLQPTTPNTAPSPDNSPWFPATLPNPNPVTNNILGVWNTVTAPDGVYELRLVVNVSGQNPQYFRVSPLRVVNNPEVLSPFAPSNDARPPLQATPTQVGVFPSGAEATQAALATLFANQSAGNGNGNATAIPQTTGPTVTAAINANVRRGDSTLYPSVGSLITGQSAPILGISSMGTGWYYIQLPDGKKGFISPSTVNVSGNINGLPIINPPPVPATPTPLPTATPATSPDLLPSGMKLEPTAPGCNQAFNVFVNITNAGTGPSLQAVQVQVYDKHVRTGQTNIVNIGAAPILSPGQNWVVTVPLTVSAYIGEEHEVFAVVDFDGAIPESNEGNNGMSTKYTLGSGSC